ncbi:Alpha-N-acetylgalactosaminidase (Alpha-galactosidase B) [Durusdinium trenchii]|uniref:Alpha-galactosidase n=1 Tax=Durusdinium trenchii TaxID=1381693 RepID=A0ABP0J500_9DINO
MPTCGMIGRLVEALNIETSGHLEFWAAHEPGSDGKVFPFTRPTIDARRPVKLLSRRNTESESGRFLKQGSAGFSLKPGEEYKFCWCLVVGREIQRVLAGQLFEADGAELEEAESFHREELPMLFPTGAPEAESGPGCRMVRRGGRAVTVCLSGSSWRTPKPWVPEQLGDGTGGKLAQASREEDVFNVGPAPKILRVAEVEGAEKGERRAGAPVRRLGDHLRDSETLRRCFEVLGRTGRPELFFEAAVGWCGGAEWVQKRPTDSPPEGLFLNVRQPSIVPRCEGHLAWRYAAVALENGLALTPPMGWMTWQRYRCNMDCDSDPSTCINEQLIKEMADRMAEAARGERSPVRGYFCVAVPISGREGKGLKFATYGDIGAKTCQGFTGFQGSGRPGEFGAFLFIISFLTVAEADAQTFAEWKVDYLKVDGCFESPKDMARDYPAFGAALNQTGRPIVYSCSWPAYMPSHCEKSDHCMDSLVEHCNLWRNFDDVQDSWDSVKSIANFWRRRNASDEMVRAAGPGHWNDPDMLLVGDFGLSPSQEQTQFALWAIWAAPLFMSNNLRDIKQSSKEILLNREIIAVNQDLLGHQGFCVGGCDGDLRIWAKPLVGGETAAVLQNLQEGGDGENITLTMAMLPWKSRRIFKARDLFAQQDLGLFREELTLYVHVNSCRMVRLSDVIEMMV